MADVEALIARRAAAAEGFFSGNADAIAHLCSRMAERFGSGGRLLALAADAAARSDARHVAVEFVHPVIVGKRALPALALVDEPAELPARVAMLASPLDMLIAFHSGSAAHLAAVASAILVARQRGVLTIAFDERLGAEQTFVVPTDDPFIQQELAELCYHIVWELVHVFFEHGGTTARERSDLGASRFLYPFLTPAPVDMPAVLRDVAASVRAKAADAAALRRSTLPGDALVALEETAAAVRERLDRGATILALGNGGSATDAMDLVADLRKPPPATDMQPCRALDLTEDTAILTALANDVGSDLQFSRQIIAYARTNDVLIAFSTSGNSRDVIAALHEAGRRGVLRVAFVGYAGGAIASERLAEHVLLAPSQHIPRIQEAHAMGYHMLRTLIG